MELADSPALTAAIIDFVEAAVLNGSGDGEPVGILRLDG